MWGRLLQPFRRRSKLNHAAIASRTVCVSPRPSTTMMRVTTILLSLLSAALVAPGSHAADAPPRQRILLDTGWRFYRGEIPASPPVSRGTAVTHWRWMADEGGKTDAAKMAASGLDTTGAAWEEAATGKDVFGGRLGFMWYRTTLPEHKARARLALRMRGRQRHRLFERPTTRSPRGLERPIRRRSWTGLEGRRVE